MRGRSLTSSRPQPRSAEPPRRRCCSLPTEDFWLQHCPHGLSTWAVHMGCSHGLFTWAAHDGLLREPCSVSTALPTGDPSRLPSGALRPGLT